MLVRERGRAVVELDLGCTGDGSRVGGSVVRRISASYTRSLSGSGATPPSRTKPPSSFVMASTYEPLPLLARSRYGKKDATRSRRTSTPMTPTMPPCASLMGLLYVMEGVPAHPKSTGRPQ